MSEKIDVDKAMQAAQIAERREHFIGPGGANALHYYQAILSDYPSHIAAREGVNRIEDLFLYRAKLAAVRGDEDIYQKNLAFLNRIDGKSLAVLEARQLQVKGSAEGILRYVLAEGQLQRDQAKLKRRVGQAAQAARLLQSRMLIIAKTDADGRWIYQLMRKLHPDYQFRANIQLGSPSRIELLDGGKK